MDQSKLSPEIIRLFNDVSGFLVNQQDISKQHIFRLLTVTRPHVTRIEKDNKTNAAKFNVFFALGVDRKEVIQSRFLAYLLDPNEDHCQNSLFLDALLAKMGLPKLGIGQSSCIKVATEHSAEKDRGRMDIVLFCKPDWLIVIENKIDAGEGIEQLPRYAEWLQEQPGYSQKHLIFLTPTGHESVTGKAGNYLQFSYLDLAEAFIPLSSQIKQISVRNVINQYITICQHIGGIDVINSDKELSALLTKPENIRVTFEIEHQAQLIRSQVIKGFGENIKNILQEKIVNSELQTKWKAESIYWENDNTLVVDIRTLRHQTKSNYKMVAEHVFNVRKDKGWAGWYRPQWVDLKKQPSSMLETNNLTNKMLSNGCGNPEGWWVGWKYLRDGKKGFVATDIDHIVACLADNQSEAHALATEIANELWEMFATYRQDIEALESFNQEVT